MARLIVLGAGVLGATVAITLRLAGHDVRVVTEKQIGDSNSQRDPSFASAYPTASIIPQSVALNPFGGTLAKQ
jgi:glycine/D-amino acid oxidase-like deaminating enzyme